MDVYKKKKRRKKKNNTKRTTNGLKPTGANTKK